MCSPLVCPFVQLVGMGLVVRWTLIGLLLSYVVGDLLGCSVVLTAIDCGLSSVSCCIGVGIVLWISTNCML